MRDVEGRLQLATAADAAEVGPVAAPGWWQTVLALWRMARPEFWTVSLLPFYTGWVMASHHLAPGMALWAEFWNGAVHHGASMHDFFVTLGGFFGVARTVLVGAAVVGPLGWAATLYVNDLNDIEGDRLNPRKARSPLVRGVVSVATSRRAMYVVATGAVAGAATIGFTFLCLVAACGLLSWAYSAPPLRWKSKPGLDLMVNAVGVGSLTLLAGWSLERPLGDFPFVVLPASLLLGVGVYVPTLLLDLLPDRDSGYTTLGARLGPQMTYRIGWWAWVAANLYMIWLAATEHVLTRTALPILLVLVPVLLYQYRACIGRARDQVELMRGIVVCSVTFFAVATLVAFMYTGIWRH
jgi:lycopene elongase/hydratase (dihydrobisanhydrobacterioruberin-forming)